MRCACVVSVVYLYHGRYFRAALGWCSVGRRKKICVLVELRDFPRRSIFLIKVEGRRSSGIYCRVHPSSTALEKDLAVLMEGKANVDGMSHFMNNGTRLS